MQTEPAAGRPIALRMRPDLQVRAQTFARQRYWAVKDPISLKYFHLREEEYTVLTMLDGRASLDEIRRRSEPLLAPRTLSNVQLQDFLATLHRYGLVVAESPGQGEQLLLRQVGQRRTQRYQKLLGVLAIRFRGINPQGLLDWLDPKCRWLFSPVMVFACLLLAMAAAVLVAVEFETFRSRLPEVHSLLGASNLPWLVLALAATKILHELGHGLACRHFGGDCHEIGLMLLVFTPCLYCNVSDSWMLPSKWQRMAIAAAGMYVELILASVCTFVWWFSQSGVLNSVCLNTVLICSLGTVLFNGNPLLRYDGYFILSDFVEVPNLAAESTAAAQRLLARWCLGLDVPLDRPSPSRRQGLLLLYSVASTAYRWMVVITILWALNVLAQPYHLEPLVAILGCVTLVGMFAPAMAAAARLARNPSRQRRIAPARAALTALLLAAAVAAFGLLAVPMRVAAPVVIEYRDAERVYVTVPGTLIASLRIGQTVEQGQVLAQLASASVEMELAKLTSERDRQRLFLADLEARRLHGAADGSQVPAAKAALADVQQRLDQLQRDAERLTIVAPCSGTLLPPPALPRKPRVTDKLDKWSGMPFDERNRGAYLDVGTLLCLVGNPTRFEAVLHVEQTDIELVQPGQQVQIVLDTLPSDVFSGEVAEIAKLDLKVMPRELAAAGDLPSRTDQRGVSHPLDTWYQARVRFDQDPSNLLAGVHGRAKISVAPRSPGEQLVRYLKQTFSRAGAPRH